MKCTRYIIVLVKSLAQLSGAAENTGCISAEG